MQQITQQKCKNSDLDNFEAHNLGSFSIDKEPFLELRRFVFGIEKESYGNVS